MKGVDERLYASKQFPDNYSNAVLEVFNAMSMTGLKHLRILGSSSVRSQQYTADFDADDTVKGLSVKEVANEMANIIKRVRAIPDCYITDIKCGEVPEWVVIHDNAYIENGKVHNFNAVQSQAIVDRLRDENVISQQEADEAAEYLRRATTPFGFLDAKKSIKFHILRWTPHDILEGALEYRGHIFRLEDAIESGGLIKIDVVANIRRRFIEFAVVYHIYKGKKLITKQPPNMDRSLGEDIIYYEVVNPFKALKRMFSLAKLRKNGDVAKHLVSILNGDLGRLYLIINDLTTLFNRLDHPNPPIKKIRDQIDEMRQRLGNIYLLDDILKNEQTIIGKIQSVLKTPTPKLQSKLDGLINDLRVILDENTFKEVRLLRRK